MDCMESQVLVIAGGGPHQAALLTIAGR